MTTILSQNHTLHIMLSTSHHNIKNTSTQHHKHMYIIISTSTQHHIILKGSRDSTSHIKEFITQDTHHFFPKKKKNSSFSFEISLEFLKFLIFFLSVILSLEFWISLLNFEFFLSDIFLEVLDFSLEIWFFFFEFLKFFTTIKSHQHNGSHQFWSKHNRTKPKHNGSD